MLSAKTVLYRIMVLGCGPDVFGGERVIQGMLELQVRNPRAPYPLYMKLDFLDRYNFLIVSVRMCVHACEGEDLSLTNFSNNLILLLCMWLRLSCFWQDPKIVSRICQHTTRRWLYILSNDPYLSRRNKMLIHNNIAAIALALHCVKFTTSKNITFSDKFFATGHSDAIQRTQG